VQETHTPNQYEEEAGRSSAIGEKQVKRTSVLTLIHFSSPQNLALGLGKITKGKMVRPWVELADYQYKELKRLRE